jgi:hypothetical protein
MTGETGGRKFSRRGLLGIFGVGAKGFRDSLERSAHDLAPGTRPAPKEPPRPGRKLRPPEDTLAAASDGQGGFLVDLRPRPIAVGASARLAGPALAEPLLAVRVHERHVAVVGGECPVDGSDLLWLQFEDRAACPSCGSRWRLDGDLMRGPADCRLGTFLVDETAGLLRLRAIGG